MPDVDIIDTKKRISSILKLKGPSLPVQIASQTSLSSLFAGALLSELAKEKTIKISSMKVGGSPLYFLKGQETMLEKFYPHLPGKEKEAFLLLKGDKILKDKEQEPAIRVALRNLKDFSIPFSKDNELFWRFYSISENEVRMMLEPKAKQKKAETKIKNEIQPKEGIKKEIAPKPETKKETQMDIGLEKPAVITEKQKKPKPMSGFSLSIIKILQNQNIEIIEEKESKKREFSAVISINSALGKLEFLCIAKDKRRITENDLRIALQKSQSLKMPALVLFPQEINKKALEYAKTCPLLKIKRFEKLS